MRYRENLVEVRVLGDPPRRRLILAPLFAVILPVVQGCVPPPSSTVGTKSIDVVPGEVASGSLYSGQAVRATAPVQEGHTYQISATVTTRETGTAGAEAVEGTIAGEPLAALMQFPVGFSTGGNPQEQEFPDTFVALVDGEVEITVVFGTTAAGETPNPFLEYIRRLVVAPVLADYELLLADLGVDDNGTTPGDAVTLSIGSGGERTGTIGAGDDGDYFRFSVQAGTTYRLTLEATDSAEVISGSEDRFGNVNFGIATPGGVLINVNASSGNPGTSEFSATADEELFLRVTARITGTGGSGTSSALAVQYAVGVVAIAAQGG